MLDLGTQSTIKRRRIELREWETQEIPLTATEVRDLLQCPPKVLTIQQTGNGCRVRAGSFVGCLRLGDTDLVIRPKYPMPSLLMMLAEVHHLAKLTPQQAAYGQSEDIADLLIQIFLHQVNLVLQYGLKRSYIQCQEDLIAVRGRIDLRRTSHLHLIGQAATHCRFEDYTLDAPENRLLLTALRAIEKCDSLSPHRRSLAHRLADEFYGVTATSEVSLDDFPRDRLSSHYYPALPLADLILRSMGIVNEVGVVMADGFLLDMNRLFEEFVRKRLARELGKSGIKVEGQQESWFDTEKQAKIKPDLLITARHGQLVADTKYKVTNDPGPADLYQMLAYCRVLNIDRGILITVGEARNRTFQVRDGETQITVCPIQLHGGIEEIEWSIRSLGRWIKARVAC